MLAVNIMKAVTANGQVLMLMRKRLKEFENKIAEKKMLSVTKTKKKRQKK